MNSHRPQGIALVSFVFTTTLLVALSSARLTAEESEILSESTSATCDLLVHNRGYFSGACWFLACAGEDPINLGCGLAQMHEVSDLEPSHDRRWLAVISAGEGHPVLEIVDLELLIASHRYHAVAEFNPYPGTIAILRWVKGALVVTSDISLPDLPAQPEDRSALLLDSRKNFAVTVDTWQVRRQEAPSTSGDPPPNPSLQRAPPG